MALTNYNDLIWDRVVEARFFTTDYKFICNLNDISNFTINGTSTTKDKTDSMGVLIKRYYQAKAIEVSGENATFNFGLAALQFGGDPIVATSADKIAVPTSQHFEIAQGTTTVTLAAAPIAGTLMVAATDSSGLVTVGGQFDVATTADATHYAISGTTLTVPTGYTGGLSIRYDRQSADAIKAVDYSDKFPETCILEVDVLCCAKCDKESTDVATFQFPSFQMSPDFSISTTTDSTHNFSGAAQSDACSCAKSLVNVYFASDFEYSDLNDDNC